MASQSVEFDGWRYRLEDSSQYYGKISQKATEFRRNGYLARIVKQTMKNRRFKVGAFYAGGGEYEVYHLYVHKK